MNRFGTQQSRVCAWLAMASCTLLFPRAAAAFPTSRLVYARGPGAEACPEQDAVRRAVAARLGYDPFFPSSDKTIIARVLRDSQGLRGQVELVDEHGVQVGLREFTAKLEECEDLVRAMALSISIAIDPKSAESYGQGPPDEPATSEAEAQEAAAPVATAAPTSLATAVPAAKPVAPAKGPQDPSLNASLGFGALTAFQVLPKTSFGLTAFGALRYRSWSMGLEGEADFPTVDHAKNVRSSSWALHLAPCWHLGVGFACQVTALRWLTARRTDADENGGSRALVALGGRLGLELGLGRSFTGLGYADLVATPTPVTLRSQEHEVWKTPVLSGRLVMGLAFHFR